MPSCVAQAGAVGAQAAGAQACTNITTYMPSCVGGGGAGTVAADAAAMYGGPVAGAALHLCIVTNYPTNCGQFCLTYHTARPTNCDPVFCATFTYPTRGPICRINGYPTHGPICYFGGLPTRIICNTNFPSCLQEVTVTLVTDPGPLAQGAAAQAQMAPQAMCITLHTAAPTWCNPCQPIANTAATLCTQHITAGPDPGTVICPTLYTATPTGCG
jgi:hypothetical protein